MASRFLFNEALWTELETLIPKAKRTRAAIAYLGSNAATLLPLKKGDKLVVDLSLRAVRAGATDPREVRKYLRRGVEVFSREHLHAKFLIADRTLIAGSANISQNARHTLEEAAVLTTDPAAVRRAVDTFEKLCTEPVRSEYLAKCIDAFEPPKFLGGSRKPAPKPPKLWIIGGLRYRDLPEQEHAAFESAQKKLAKKRLEFEKTEVDASHYPAPQKLFAKLREGDWLITCIGDGKGYDVTSPARFLGIEHYPRGDGKNRYVLCYEVPTGGELVRWTKFRKAVPASVPIGGRDKPVTKAIVSEADADALLRLWDGRGRFRLRKS